MSSTEIESPVRSLNDIPSDEKAREIPKGNDDVDLHTDPDMAPEERDATEAPVTPWRVAKGLLALRAQVNARFPGRSKDSDGTIGDASHQTRDSDHNPWVRDGTTGVVTAMDITHDPAHGCDSQVLAETIRTSRDARVKYIISNRRIASSEPTGGKAAWEWRPYTGANPHNKHVHISVKSDKGSYDSSATWAI
jgi:hypothetical protein